MRNVKIEFTVANNSNLYYATSFKAILDFCKRNDFVILDYSSHIPTPHERKVSSKVGRGVYCIHEMYFPYLKEMYRQI